eukprot:gene13542-9694_t
MSVVEKIRWDKVGKNVLIWTSAAAVTYSIYWYYLGRKHSESRNELQKKLEQAEKMVQDLEEKLLSLEQLDLQQDGEGSSKSGKKEIRIWMDGVFDMMHYGHVNAFRQGRSLGTHLIVGVNSDETITKCKGKPICSEQERIDTVRGCKFVDEVVEGVPYVMNDEYLEYVIKKYRIDYIVHGDDPCIVDGKNVYESAVKLGKYLTIPRTEGISTTDIVGRMLLMSTFHHHNNTPSQHSSDQGSSPGTPGTPLTLASRALVKNDPQNGGVLDRKSNFLTTSRILRLFHAGARAPKPTDRVVYVAGAWDMFHAGHIEFLEKARAFGDYLIVGVHNDTIVNQRQGMNLPILTLQERVLSVLGCTYVDDALIDASEEVTADMIAFLRISTVVIRDTGDNSVPEAYALAAQQGLLQKVAVSYSLSALDFVDRILNQRERYADRFQKKMAAEQEFYKNKYNL